ncbi:hypothetical protein [Sinorhizobium sp. BG8]|uniref:hypothetical protein n=1 Tax=Sinorhizobium sp. BG8 TaxID=2613773 RepID=UPI00193D04F0|nr:hypothetical protein [Sinorhizobium sp. BG8]QRM56715.1 hypothetical protein F3Y30_20885 [Sinorhizobium sp. BG8]
MKMLMIASMAAIVASGLWAFASRQVQDGPDPIVVASIAKPNPQKTYSIANAAEHTSCLAQRGEKLSNRSLRFSAGPDCDLVWPGLSKARTWIETGDGMVVVGNAKGEAIITIAEGDGLAYEAIEPSDALLTMAVVD